LEVDLRILLDTEAAGEAMAGNPTAAAGQELLRQRPRLSPVDFEPDRGLGKGASEESEGDRPAHRDDDQADRDESNVFPVESFHLLVSIPCHSGVADAPKPLRRRRERGDEESAPLPTGADPSLRSG